MKYCTKCGHALPDEALFCSECGTKQGEIQQQNFREKPVKTKQKTDLSAYLKPKIYVTWSAIAVGMLLMNIFFALLGVRTIALVVLLILWSLFAAGVNVANFIYRIKHKGKIEEIVTNGVFMVMDTVCLICAFVLL